MTGKIAYVLLVLAAFLTALVLLSMGRRRVAVTRTRGLRGMFMVLVAASLSMLAVPAQGRAPRLVQATTVALRNLAGIDYAGYQIQRIHLEAPSGGRQSPPGLRVWGRGGRTRHEEDQQKALQGPESDQEPRKERD